MRWVYAALLAYVIGFTLFWPRVFLVVDEERYVSQAVAFSQGGLTIDGGGIIHPSPAHATISNYPPGTALLQTPLVWAFGWRAAAVLSVLSLLIATLVTARWLRASGRNPAFSLMIPGFLGASLFGRIAMSDLPATAVVAGTCYFLWRAEGSVRSSLFAGFLAGASVLFREPPVVMLGLLLAGAAMRRQLVFGAAAIGFALGILLRLGLYDLLFGTSLFLRDSGYGFSLASLGHSLPIYGAILLLMLPGGALLPFLYRGERRVEMVAAICAYLPIFLLFESNSVRESGLVKGLLHASRYMVPLLPLLAYLAAEVGPRLLARVRERFAPAAQLPSMLMAGAVLMAFLVHPIARRQEQAPLAIVRGFYSHTSAAIPVITNTDATLKYLSAAYGPRQLILRYGLSLDTVAELASRHGSLSIAFLNRSDSENFRRDAAGNDLFLAGVGARCQVTPAYEERLGSWALLRVLDVKTCR